MSGLSPSAIVRSWWTAIDRADFEAAVSLMASGAVVDWPLSNERMVSPAMWQAVNEHYPGRWHAKVTSTVAEGDQVVSVTEISDGSITVIAISFFTIRKGLIARLVEYWPEPYAPPAGRAQWTVPIVTVTAD